MKTTIALFAATLLTLSAIAVPPILPAPTNPPPVVSLGWTASPDPTVTNYNIYYGVASGQYTNVTAVGNVTNATIPLPARGVTYFFAATATAPNALGVLESTYSNEISYTPKAIPGAPGMKPPVTLAVQTKSAMDFMWADTGMEWSISPDSLDQFFRLQIKQAPQVAQIQPLTLRVKMPPLPGQ